MPDQTVKIRKLEAKRQLDSLVVNVELTLVSIIQGVALAVLTQNASASLASTRFGQWLYVMNGLLLIFLFWSRSVAHTITLIRWPLQFSHNFLYIACTLFQTITFTYIDDPLRWYAFNGVFAVVAWLLFVIDLRLIEQRQASAFGGASRRLFATINRDQWFNIRYLVPAMMLFHGTASLLIWTNPAFFIGKGYHLILAATQTFFLFAYLVYVLRFFAGLTDEILTSTTED